MLLRWLVRSSWKALAVALAASLVSGACSTAALAVIHRAASTTGPRLALGLWFAGLCLLLLASRVTAQLVLVVLTQDSLLRLRDDLARRITATPLEKLERLGNHRLLAALADDVVAISAAMPGIATAGSNLAMVLGVLAYLAWLSPALFVFVVLALVIGVAVHRACVRVALRWLRRAREGQNVLYDRFKSLLEGVKELKLHRGRREEFLRGELLGAAQAFRHDFVRGMGGYVAAASWGELLSLAAVGAVALVAPAYLPAETVGGFVLAILYMAGPLQSLVGWLPTLGRAQVAVTTLHNLGLELSDERAGADGGAERPGGAALEIRGLRYRYGGDDGDGGFAIGPIDLTLHPGELVFVVGGNGGGKTTLAKLVTGLYRADDGELRLGGRLLDDANRESWRQHFAAVFPDSHLFDRLHGLEGREARALELLRLLRLDAKVALKDGSFSTTRLSRGQTRRLMLLVALLEDRPFYVFDEWAADQDPAFREVFYRQILPDLRARGKAVLAITHDEAYWPVADRILEMDGGRLRPRALALEPRPRATHPAGQGTF